MAKFQTLQERLEAYRQAKVRQTREECPSQVAETDSSKVDNRKGSEARTTEANREKQSSVADTPEESSPWWMIGLKALLWLTLFGFFVEVEFGVVFVVSSVFYFIYSSMRGSKRKSSELSAYSVFNKNFERIEGTLTADQFEREIRYGPGGVS